MAGFPVPSPAEEYDEAQPGTYDLNKGGGPFREASRVKGSTISHMLSFKVV